MMLDMGFLERESKVLACVVSCIKFHVRISFNSQIENYQSPVHLQSDASWNEDGPNELYIQNPKLVCIWKKGFPTQVIFLENSLADSNLVSQQGNKTKKELKRPNPHSPPPRIRINGR